MSLTFTAIDFETANFDRGSVCAVGLTTVEGGRIAETVSWYVDPPTGDALFTNTWLHGISAVDVAGAPSWAESLERIHAVVGRHPLVAYSAFDRGVHRAANAAAGLERANAATGLERDLEFLDVLAIARLRLPGLHSYRLAVVAEHVGFTDELNHEPGDDSRAAAHIALTIAAEAGAPSIDHLWKEVLDHRAALKEAARIRSAAYVSKGELPKANPDADATHPLYGHTVCFSGGLAGMPRDEARAIAAAHGASLELSVTKATTLLVVGDFDPATLRPGTTLSLKLQKALTLAERGQPIEVMLGADFLALVEA